MLKEQFQFVDGKGSKDLDVLELLGGISSNKLRKEMYKEQILRASELVQIARDWHQGKEVDRLFQDTAGGLRPRNTGGTRLNCSKRRPWRPLIRRFRARARCQTPRKLSRLTCSSALAVGGLAKTKTI